MRVTHRRDGVHTRDRLVCFVYQCRRQRCIGCVEPGEYHARANAQQFLRRRQGLGFATELLERVAPCASELGALGCTVIRQDADHVLGDVQQVVDVCRLDRRRRQHCQQSAASVGTLEPVEDWLAGFRRSGSGTEVIEEEARAFCGNSAGQRCASARKASSCRSAGSTRPASVLQE